MTTELTGLVQIDVDRELAVPDIGEELADLLADLISIPLTNKPRPPADLRKFLKTKEVPTLDKLKQVLAVTDDDSFQRVGLIVKGAVAAAKWVEDEIAEDKELAARSHKRICDREFNAQFAYNLVRQAGDTALNAFRVKQKREAEEQARKEQEAAQAEQRRLQAEADNKLREQRALEAKALEAKRSGDMAAAREAAREALVAVETAEILRDAAIAVVEEIQHAPAPMTKIAGRVEKWPWVAECKDVLVFARAVLSGEHPSSVEIDGENIPALLPNPKYGKYFAKRLEANAKLAGWEFREELQTAQRTK